MDRILELLGAALDTFNAETLAARLAELTADELAELQELLAAEFETARTVEDGQRRTPEQVALMGQLADVIDAARSEDDRREGEAQELEQRAAEIEARVAGEPGDDDPAGDGEQTDDADEGVDDTPPAEPEEQAEEPEAVAAASTPPAPVPLSRASRHRPASSRRAPARGEGRVGRIVGPNGELASIRDIAVALGDRQSRLGMNRSGVEERIPVARIEAAYPAERRIDREMTSPEALDEMLATAHRDHIQTMLTRLDQIARGNGSLESLTAAGGRCAPLTPFYDQEVVGVTDRPGRDALVQFQATRGGITFIPAPTLSDIVVSTGQTAGSAVSHWPMATDESPGGATKPCQTVECDTATDVEVDAIVNCLRFGNFIAKYYPERAAAFTRLALVAGAREAERTLLANISTLSTALTTNANLGVTRDLLHDIGLLSVAMRDRDRSGENTPYQVFLPFWVKEMIRADLARQLPGDNTYAVTDAQIADWFRVRRVIPTFLLDDDTGASFNPQAAAIIQPFPATVEWYMFAAGTFTFLDGGGIDLGLVRDSTLNSTNDFLIFSEVMENVAKTGSGDAFKVTSSVCADGSSVGTVDPPACGS